MLASPEAWLRRIAVRVQGMMEVTMGSGDLLGFVRQPNPGCGRADYTEMFPNCAARPACIGAHGRAPMEHSRDC